MKTFLCPAQIAFMQLLMAEGAADERDIVFLDMDVLVVDSLAEVAALDPLQDKSWYCPWMRGAAQSIVAGLEWYQLRMCNSAEGRLKGERCMQIFANGAPFDYGVTLSDAVDMPVNLGMQFVPRGRYMNAIAFLNDVIAIYPFNETFIAGQVGHRCTDSQA